LGSGESLIVGFYPEHDGINFATDSEPDKVLEPGIKVLYIEGAGPAMSMTRYSI